MADISQELSTISENRLGENVRGSIHDSILKINDESSLAELEAISASDSAVNLRDKIETEVEEIHENVEETKTKMDQVDDIYNEIGEWPAKFSVEDDDGDPILDSDGDPIYGEIIFIIKK